LVKPTKSSAAAVKEDGVIRSSRNLRVCVLAGGDSAERGISLASGRGVAAALAAAGCQVTCIDPQPIDCVSTARSGGDGSPDSSDRDFPPALWHQIAWQDFDACFLALHGGAGEDGRLQAYLAARGVPFTGCTAHAARVAMSKAASKDRFRAVGVPTPDYRTFGRDTSHSATEAGATAIGYPLIVKPDAQGSSLGVTLVRSADQLAGGVRAALELDTSGLLEAFIPGREFTVAVLGRDPLPLIEVYCAEPVFSYAVKYDSQVPHYRFDTGLPPAEERALVDAAVGAAVALETTGLVRVDLRADAAGHPWVLELNATPGMTPASLAPAAARQAGIEMPDLCRILIEECLKRGMTI
jgi:D-alanine-D-alanine ligase